jgi:hypothetical protein
VEPPPWYVTSFKDLHLLALALRKSWATEIVVCTVPYALQGDSDMDDYGFEYSDDDYIEEDVDIENQYYNSKGMLVSFSSNAFWFVVNFFLILLAAPL